MLLAKYSSCVWVLLTPAASFPLLFICLSLHILVGVCLPVLIARSEAFFQPNSWLKHTSATHLLAAILRRLNLQKLPHPANFSASRPPSCVSCPSQTLEQRLHPSRLAHFTKSPVRYIHQRPSVCFEQCLLPSSPRYGSALIASVGTVV